jgi:hypothetical protein
MKKTSVYLTEEEADGLARLAAATGRSQADLIRDGIRRVLENDGNGARRFHSLGKGHGDGTPYAPWRSEDLYDSVMNGLS